MSNFRCLLSCCHHSPRFCTSSIARGVNGVLFFTLYSMIFLHILSSSMLSRWSNHYILVALTPFITNDSGRNSLSVSLFFRKFLLPINLLCLSLTSRMHMFLWVWLLLGISSPLFDLFFGPTFFRYSFNDKLLYMYFLLSCHVIL